MNTHHRGVYQPLVENFSVSPLSEESEDEERSRLPLLIVIGLIVLAAFLGVIWIAYNQGIARGRASVVLVTAPEGPVRTAPENAQGPDSLFTGLKIYNQPVPPDAEDRSSRLAPASVPALRPPPEAPAPQARVQPAPQAPAVRPAAEPQAPVDSPAQNAQPAPGGIMLQIGAYPSMDLAQGAYDNFKARFGQITGNVSEDVQKADLGAKGTWYRVRVGPYASKPAAVATCLKLKAQGGSCFVAAP
jgi:cell division septation protein DedD